ncbi:MAG TPA: MarR family transcriptional regulator [Rubricoccaceae bacterium]|jgi:DNA-binding MarR family transcriptional regulator|nr:MarR family transcriptional regulator [Rubricoccaceae bacterium]
MHLAELIRQSRFASPAQEAVLNVIATESWLAGEIADALAPYGVTPTQYNVLRILRGGHPEPYTCSMIAERLLDRTPDVTRLLCRLEREDLITRCRGAHDRRVVEVSITEKGLALLDRLDAPVQALMERITRHLSEDELRTLSRLLEALRADQA